jgi:hypothetical protein
MKRQNSSYRMSKKLKFMLSTISNAEQRNVVKRIMIEGELAALAFQNNRRSRNSFAAESSAPKDSNA